MKNLQIDEARESRRISRFITKTTADAGAKGIVVGLSGGVDSSVVGALCVGAVGKRRVVGLLMPSEHTPHSDIADVLDLAQKWGIRTSLVRISNLVEKLVSSVGGSGGKLANANVQARVRMTILYYIANRQNLLVAGTGDRSESLLGYFSKWGDGGVDFLPIAHLYKTQVRELGKYLGLPNRIVNKPASPRLWSGHRATDEIPTEYVKLDYVLHYLFDDMLSVEETALKAGVSRAIVAKVLQMHRKTAHKRALPPSLL